MIEKAKPTERLYTRMLIAHIAVLFRKNSFERTNIMWRQFLKKGGKERADDILVYCCVILKKKILLCATKPTVMFCNVLSRKRPDCCVEIFQGNAQHYSLHFNPAFALWACVHCAISSYRHTHTNSGLAVNESHRDFRQRKTWKDKVMIKVASCEKFSFCSRRVTSADRAPWLWQERKRFWSTSTFRHICSTARVSFLRGKNNLPCFECGKETSMGFFPSRPPYTWTR